MIDDEGIEKPEHPQKNSNCISTATFWYTLPIFRKGLRKDFEEADLTKPLDDHKSSILGDKISVLWEKEKANAKKHNFEPKLARSLIRLVLKDVVSQGMLLFFIEICVRMCQPLFLGIVLRYFSDDHDNETEIKDSPTYMMRILHIGKKQGPVSLNEAIFFSCGVFLCTFSYVLVQHPSMMAMMHTGLKLKVACCSLIYRKTLRLSLEALGGSTVGTVLNLMSNDVSRFDLSVMYLNYIWLAPFQMLIALLLMYTQVELASVVGISTMVAVIPLQAWFGNRTSRFRLKTAYRTDERVRQMNQIIQGMQVIKMYTWEYAFAQQIEELRKKEMRVLRATSFIRGAIMSFIMFTTRLAIFATILAVIYRGRQITAEKVYVVTSFYQILRQTMTLFFPYALAQIAETHVAVSRIKSFLLLPEMVRGTDEKKRRHNFENDDPGIAIKSVSASIEGELCLQNVSVEIENGEMAAIIGQVGSGKSSLLHVILGELKPTVGSASVQGNVSYASQEPWLFAGSVRQNILFGQYYEKERYRNVVQACALVRDFELLPYGDSTIVGEKGTSLSGGQRARINLARAVYKKADIYLLDDPLSAVDSHVGKHLFDKCICGFLKGKIVILVTHQLQFLANVQKVILMHDGMVEASGSYEYLKTTTFDFAKFMQGQMGVDTDSLDLDAVSVLSGKTPAKANRVEAIMKELHIKSQMDLVVVDIEGQQYKPKQVAEMRTEGSVECEIYAAYFRAGGNCCLIFSVIFLFLAAQVFASACDSFLAEWIIVEEKRERDEESEDSKISTDGYVGIYSVFMLMLIVVALTRSFVFFSFCMRASVNLHNRMFESVITACMQFFNTNTSGRILNRFSKDLGAIDEFLPNAMIDCTQIMLNLVGTAAVVIYVSYYLAIPTVLMCISFYFIRRYYIASSRSLKRLEGISKSPMFAHVNATIQGLATIRSNGAEELLIKEFDQLQDDNSSAWYMFLACSRAFGYCLDLICTMYIGIVALSFLVSEASGSYVGLAITQAISLTGLFQWGMKQSAELENQMTSVERVLEYSRIEHEPDLESKPDQKPPPDWPDRGHILFEDLVMKYKPEDPPVLKSLNLDINPREKIGIVGRTGAGKSSLIAALFRLGYFDGAIIIDKVNTKDIGLHDLRRKISIIPQEPVLFSGTLRYNMDPFQNYSDEEVLQALGVVESKVVMHDGPNSLNHYVSEGGANISVGERQMICLARAILRNNRILVLDEATANVDPQTDQFIQKTIRERFEQCTVLTIAHRLHTIMDSDRVLVMDAGKVVEFDHPHVLLNNKFGTFTGMVQKTGHQMAHNLKDIARKNYESRQGASGV